MGARGKSALFRDEMAQRGFEVIPKLHAPGLPGVLFRAGSRVELTDVVDARSTDSPFFAGTVTGLYAEDSSLPRSIGASFAAIPLPRPVPHILLLGTGIGMLKLAGVSLGANQRLSLEGDFDRTYSLYCQIGGSSLALSVFTPELLQQVIDNGSNSDIEVVDNWMFVYGNASETSSGQMLDAIEKLAERVGGAIVSPAFEGEAGAPAGGPAGRIDGAGQAKKTSGLTLVVVTIVAVAAGALFTLFGSGLY